MISSFRERPLALFVLAALAPFTVAVAAACTWALRALAGWKGYGDEVVLPTIVLLLVALTVHLIMLGLLAEAALARSRLASTDGGSPFELEIRT